MKAFVIARDRVTYARRCVDALLAAGLDVIVVDHGSTWPPMLRWLSGVNRPRGMTTWADQNWHPRDLWRESGPIACNVRAGERFVVTDCDVVPDKACPADWLDQLGALLDNHPAARKAGLGLRTDDLPPHFAHRRMVQAWERKYQHVDDGGLLHHTGAADGAMWADIDTTLALYRNHWNAAPPYSPEPFRLGPALRMRPPYVARHLPWYEDSTNPSAEQAYYQERARYGHWCSADPASFTDDHALGGDE